MSIYCPLLRLRRKVSLAKGKPISSDLGIIYTAPKISKPNLNFKLRWLRRREGCEKGNPFLQILEYSTLRPKFQTQIWISNFVGTKFSCWHLRIISFWIQLGSSLGLEIPRYSSGRFLFDFPVGVYYASPFLGNYMNKGSHPC